ncbi:MAG: hypothetical protein GY910_17715 [bacterium]|nr:hypothetical protein [bacterium]
MRRALVLSILVLATSGCLGMPGSLPPCDSWSADHAICGLMNPEDLGSLPHGGWVVVSEMHLADPRAGEEAGPFLPGRLTAIRSRETDGKIERRQLFPNEWAEAATETNRWGDPGCEGPPSSEDFQPHGIDVGMGPEGRSALAVVTHGFREVIDLFEIAAGSEPALAWRGCVEMLGEMSANDVALLGDGSLVVTNMIPRLESVGVKAIWIMLKIRLGLHTGSVLHWSPSGGWSELQKSQASAPNGIATSADGHVVYVAEWGGGAVYRLRFAGGLRGGAIPLRDEVAVEGHPSQLTWTADGRLLVGAQRAGPIKVVSCGRIEAGGCDIGYSVTSIEVDDLVATKVAEGRGAVSVALEVDDEIWLGVFAGDSVTRLPKVE